MNFIGAAIAVAGAAIGASLGNGKVYFYYNRSDRQTTGITEQITNFDVHRCRLDRSCSHHGGSYSLLTDFPIIGTSKTHNYRRDENDSQSRIGRDYRIR